MLSQTQLNALAACVLLVIPVAAFADDESQTSDRSNEYSYLDAMLVRATCQTNYVTGLIGFAISDIANIDQTVINADSTKLNTELQALNSDVNNTDKTQFRIDLKLFRSDSKNATLDLRSATKNAHPTDDEKTKLKSDIDSLKEKWKSCTFDAGHQLANVKIRSFGIGIEKIENKTRHLESKGVDTTHLNELVIRAQTNLGNLSASVASAKDTAELKTALKGYCQYNGCKNGVNFHLAAQAALTAEQSVLDKIKSNPNSGQYIEQIDEAQSDLTKVQNILNDVGTNQYQESQKTDVWNFLHDAKEILQKLWVELNAKSKVSTSS